MCAALFDICLTDATYSNRSFAYASMNSYHETGLWGIR